MPRSLDIHSDEIVFDGPEVGGVCRSRVREVEPSAAMGLVRNFVGGNLQWF